MKKIVFACMLLALVLSYVPARAMETNSYFGAITSGKPFVQYITTYRPGNVSAHVTWSGKPTGHGIAYWLGVYHCTDAGGTCYFAYDMSCFEQSTEWPTQEMSCTIPNGPAGIYEIEFSADTKATFGLQIIAETNP